jgi:hypothetical protein
MMRTSLRFHFVHLVIFHLAIFCLHFVIDIFMKEATHLLLSLFFTHCICVIFLH